MSATNDRIARFHREARAAAALNLPNVVTLFSVEESAAFILSRWSWWGGLPLHELIPHGFPTDRVIELATALAEAVAAAHDKDLAHRDLSQPTS